MDNSTSDSVATNTFYCETNVYIYLKLIEHLNVTVKAGLLICASYISMYHVQKYKTYLKLLILNDTFIYYVKFHNSKVFTTGVDKCNAKHLCIKKTEVVH